MSSAGSGEFEGNASRGVLITSPDGTIYNVPLDELERFRVAEADVDQVIQQAEASGLLPASGSCGEDDEPEGEPAGDSGRTVINIFIGGGGEPQVGLQHGTLEKSVGSTMSKYAAGSTMSKYAAGSTMSKYAAGSTMSKYAAGSTMAAAGQIRVPIAVFYGAWDRSG